VERVTFLVREANPLPCCRDAKFFPRTGGRWLFSYVLFCQMMLLCPSSIRIKSATLLLARPRGPPSLFCIPFRQYGQSTLGSRLSARRQGGGEGGIPFSSHRWYMVLVFPGMIGRSSQSFFSPHFASQGCNANLSGKSSSGYGHG